jgi:hypothetical protein
VSVGLGWGGVDETSARFLFGYFPAVAQLVLVPIAPLYRLYTSVPFASVLAFFGTPFPSLPLATTSHSGAGVHQWAYTRKLLGDS